MRMQRSKGSWSDASSVNMLADKLLSFLACKAHLIEEDTKMHM